MNILPTNRGFWKAFLFSIITFGIYQLYLSYAFAKETNIACAEDGKHTSGLLALILLGILTFGIYPLFWYAFLIDRRGNYCEANNQPNRLSVVLYLLTIFILQFLTFGIMSIVIQVKYIHQQNDVNRIYNFKQSQLAISQY